MNKIIIVDTSNISDFQYDKMYCLIDDERRKKVDKLMFFKDKKMSVVCEICLYYLLSIEYKYSNDIIKKEFTTFGKPYFKNLSDIHFSVSHSNDICMIGFSKNLNIGVDIEKLNNINNEQASQLLEKYFSQQDLELFENKKSSVEKFMFLWTQKEAFYKAKGCGISLSALKAHFLEEDIKKLKTYVKDDIIFSIYSDCKKNDILYYNSLEFENIISIVNKWKRLS